MDSKFIIGSQDSAGFDATSAWNRVRGRGLGGSAWVAKITGTHPKFNFERAFIDARKDLSRSGLSGTMDWNLDGDGVYEYRGFAASSNSVASGFVRVEGGEVEEIDFAQAKEFFAEKPQ